MSTAHPILGVPVTGPAKPRITVPTRLKVSGARKPRRTREQYQAAKEFASSMSGYNNSSPIWGKTLIEVVQLVEATLGDKSRHETLRIQQAGEALDQLKRRIVYDQLRKA